MGMSHVATLFEDEHVCAVGIPQQATNRQTLFAG
jgi:hypothetical protein